jgi:hypothetical protein
MSRPNDYCFSTQSSIHRSKQLAMMGANVLAEKIRGDPVEKTKDVPAGKKPKQNNARTPRSETGISEEAPVSQPPVPLPSRRNPNDPGIPQVRIFPSLSTLIEVQLLKG